MNEVIEAAKEEWAQSVSVDKDEFDKVAMHLAGLFKQNFAKFEKDSSETIVKAGPLKFEDLSK